MRPVDLLPASRRVQQGGNRPGIAYAAVGVLAALLVMVVVYVLSANGLTSKKDDLARVQAETQTAQQQAATLGSFGNFAEIKRTREGSITKLAQARLDWERLVRELAHVLPGDVFISSLDASAGGSAQAGNAASGATGPSLKLVGCAPSNPDVATLMIRLRKLHRSSEVTLETSARSDGQSGQGACGRGYGFALNVSFDPAPQPAAPDRVPARLGGGA